MDSRHRKKIRNVEIDRLSSLPIDLIYKILSFMDLKHVIGTSVLSPRWSFIWKSMPYLNFSTEDFSSLPKFSKVVTNVLSRRNKLTDLYSMNLNIRVKEGHMLVKRILKYAFSHNIQELNVVFLLEKDIMFPLSLFSSQSLKHLSLMTRTNKRIYRTYHEDCYFITPTSTWELPTLTTLDLHSLTFPDDSVYISVFSKCANLKNLTLKHCKTIGSNDLSISHPQLSNLTLENIRYSVKVVNVDAPQLKNLTIKYCSLEDVKISAPDLASLIFKGSHPLHLTSEGFHSLEKADVCVSSPKDAHAHQIVCMLEQLHNVKLLKLNLEIIEVLSSSQDLILHQPSPFVNLNSLKIYPETLYVYNHEPKKVAMSTKIKSYLLDSSPRSTFSMVLREEIQAQNLMAKLRVLLEEENDKSKTKRAHLEQGETLVGTHEPNKLETGDMAQIKSGWENLGVQFLKRKEKPCLIISELQRIKELLTSLPASNRAKIQPCFSSLCTKADTVITQITDCMIKIQCDENRGHSSVCFHELATTLEPSS